MASDQRSLLRRGSRSAREATRLDRGCLGGEGGIGGKDGSEAGGSVTRLSWRLNRCGLNLSAGLFFVWIKFAGLIHKIAPNSPSSKTKCSQLPNYHQINKVCVMIMLLTIGMKLDQGKNQIGHQWPSPYQIIQTWSWSNRAHFSYPTSSSDCRQNQFINKKLAGLTMQWRIRMAVQSSDSRARLAIFQIGSA